MKGQRLVTSLSDIPDVVDALCDLSDAAVSRLREALALYLATGQRPDPEARARGAFAYPELRIDYSYARPTPFPARAFGRLNQPGRYVTSIARPRLFRAYLIEQLSLLVGDYDVEVSIGPSDSEIPYPYVLDGDIALDGAQASDLSRWFPTTELSNIGDEVADGSWDYRLAGARPLALFDGPRTDFSLARLRHYTGTPPENVQRYVLFTNYVRYVDEFVRWAVEELAQPASPYTALSGPGGVVITADGGQAEAEARIADAAGRRFQMPAYHLMTADGGGITLINIGVGPSNAKTICDHLAVLRPEAWLMIGHCGGLRPSQTLGDYVLAHAYLRDDHVLDDVLPVEIPVPPIAEIQQALFAAAVRITGETPQDLKSRLRTGTVVTTDDRNWELRYTKSALRFNQSRAVAIDMESATVAAQGYRFRVPYGALLCVSDKPLHGEIKLPGQANAFYERAVSQHLRIGIETLMTLKREGATLHSRKLRSFDEPPFR
jgi:AMP nucleosidase